MFLRNDFFYKLAHEPFTSVRKLFRYTVLQWYPVQVVIKTVNVITRLHRLGYYKSLRAGKPVSESGVALPWFSYPAIQFLQQIDLTGLRVFEFGSGNSSKYFLSRGCWVTSVEDSREWYEYLKDTLVSEDRFQLFYAGTQEEYVGAVKKEAKKYDIILVDGSHRDLCLEASLSTLTPTGFLILDNAEWYPEAVAKIRHAGFAEIDFCGLGPLNGFAWSTSLFFLPGSSVPFARTKQLTVE